VLEHAVGDAGQFARRQAQAMRRVPPNLFPTVEVLEPPVFDAERTEQRFDRELVVRLPGHAFDDQRGVMQGMRRITATLPRIEGETFGALISGQPEHVLP